MNYFSSLKTKLYVYYYLSKTLDKCLMNDKIYQKKISISPELRGKNFPQISQLIKKKREKNKKTIYYALYKE